MVRRSLSKRVRFEIFKRDDFTCQYCGAHPPTVVLEVDHIFPVALGGEDDAENLITACFDCNRGKSAVRLDVVPRSLADQAADVAEREEQLRGYNEIMAARRERLDEQIWEVVELLTRERSTSHDNYNSTKRFVEMLGVHGCLDAAEIALASGLRGRRLLLYFYKVCWNKARGE